MNLYLKNLRLGSALILTPLASLALPIQSASAIPVFDVTNYTQNLLQAARSLEQINHQIASLQNEATMLQNMARNLQRIDFPEVAKIKASIEKIGGLMNQAGGIEWKVDRLDQQFKQLFPDAATGTSSDRLAGAKKRFEAAKESFRHSLGVQSGVVSSLEEDAGLLTDLIARSQSSVGSLQAQQAGNQLLALGAKQQMQLQQLLAADFRSRAIDRARALQAEEEGRAATRRFLGNGRAYTPQ